jgi:hypothetical protein
MINDDSFEERCKRLVEREIHANQTMLVNDIIAAQQWIPAHTDIEFPSWDDIENFMARQDIDDLIRENLDTYADFLLDNEDILTDQFSDEYDEYQKQIFLKNLEEDDHGDTYEPDNIEQFWGWLIDYAPFCDEEGEIRCTREELLKQIELDDDDKETLYDYFERNGVEIEDEGSEVFSWYLVSDWLANRLREKHETILEWANCTWWGRATYGQLILADGVIREIVKELYNDDTNDV